MLNQQIV